MCVQASITEVDASGEQHTVPLKVIDQDNGMYLIEYIRLEMCARLAVCLCVRARACVYASVLVCDCVCPCVRVCPCAYVCACVPVCVRAQDGV